MAADEPVEIVTDATRLAEILEGRLRGDDLYAEGSRLSVPVVVRGIRLDELVLDKPGAHHPLRFKHCRIRSVRVIDALFPRGAAFEDCTIELLDIRSWGRGRLSVLSSRIDEVRVYAVPEVCISDVMVRGGLTISNVGERVDLATVRCGELLVDDDQTGGELRLDLCDVDVAGTLSFRRIRVSEMRLADCDAAELRIERVRAASGSLSDCRFRGPLRVHVIAETGGAKLRLAARAEGNVQLHGSWSRVATAANESLVAQPDGPWALVVDAAQFIACDDVQLIGPVRLDLDGTRIDGTLRFTPGPGGVGRCVLDRESTVAAINIGSKPLRTTAEARHAAESLFGAAGPAEFTLLHRALGGRPEDQDTVYFAQRVAETRAHRGWARVSGALRGGVLGWGVRLLQPIRTLAIGVLGTAMALHLSGASRTSREPILALAPAARALVLAAALWLNVGTGLPSQKDGAFWTAAAVGFTATGIILVTVTVGVAIRRLVR